MGLSKALKFQLNKFFIALRVKKTKYSWFVVPNSPSQGYAIFRVRKKRKTLSYREWKINKKEEREINRLINTINEFLDIKENSDDYKVYVANIYKKRGYTVWEYSKDKQIKNSNELNLVLKKAHNIILVQCKNDNLNININDIKEFELQSLKFLKKNQIFENYNIKLRYAMAGLFLEESAYEYIKEHSQKIDYDIIKMSIESKYQ